MAGDALLEVWAVLDDGVINGRTLSDTRRAALVNWLYVSPNNVFIRHGTTDEQIEAMWQQSAPRHNATVEKFGLVRLQEHG